MKNQIFNFLAVVMTIVSTGVVAKAEHFQRHSDYSPIGLEACDKAAFYDRQQCLKSIRGAWFDPKLKGFCAEKVITFDILKCLKSSANKLYDKAEIRVCEREFFTDRPECLSRFGTAYRETNANEILLDAIDQVIVDLIKEAFANSAVKATEVCEVKNSTGRTLGQVSREDFRNAVSEFARRQNSCVVSNVKGEARSRELVKANGRSAGQELTEQETRSLKNAYGYDRCRVLTCVSKENREPRFRVNDNERSPRYGGGAIRESWGTR